MNLPTKHPHSRWLWSLVAALLSVFLASRIMLDKPKPPSVARDPAGAQNSENTQRALHIFAQSPTEGGRLFSKTPDGADHRGPAHRDLWFQDARHQSRWIANDVKSAQFSPDGRKFAYLNNACELFVETIEGKRLAEFTGTSDFTWRSDSAALSFSAMASGDYPDFQQSIVYDLASGEIKYLSQTE